MINTFIAALIAIFFWGKSSKDVEEKTECASIIRTLVYFVLSVVVGVFFYKTYQVAVAYDIIDIDGVRQSFDESGNVADTVSVITITNKFSSGGIENNSISKPNNEEEYKKYNETGGVYLKVWLHNNAPYSVKTNSNYNNADFSFAKFDDVAHVYQLSVVCSSIPSLIPLFPSWEGAYENSTDVDYANMVIFDVKKHPERLKNTYVLKSVDGSEKTFTSPKNPFMNAYYTTGLFAQKQGALKEPYSYFHMAASGNFINTMGFFTAADISQYIQGIQIKSNCPVKMLEVVYDINIEVSQYDSCMTIGPQGFNIKGKYLDGFINNPTASGILVKLPTLANLQLIRSLILTTVITALISLFFSNLYFWLRKQALIFKKKHFQAISEDKVKSFKRKMYVILYILLIIILWISWRILCDSPFHMPIYLDNYIEEIIAAILLSFAILVYFLFRKAYTTKNNKKKKE